VTYSEVRQIWAHKTYFPVPRPRKTAYPGSDRPGSGPAYRICSRLLTAVCRLGMNYEPTANSSHQNCGYLLLCDLPSLDPEISPACWPGRLARPSCLGVLELLQPFAFVIGQRGTTIVGNEVDYGFYTEERKQGRKSSGEDGLSWWPLGSERPLPERKGSGTQCQNNSLTVLKNEGSGRC
jgi:hypothetical protein